MGVSGRGQIQAMSVHPEGDSAPMTEITAYYSRKAKDRVQGIESFPCPDSFSASVPGK